jgi:FkbM family methyltransferase
VTDAISLQTGCNWKPISLAHAVLREAWQCESPGDTFEVRFRGSGLTLPVLQHAWSGVVNVQLDGGPVYRADLYSPFPIITLWRLVGLTEGEHTLTVQLTADAHPESLSRQVVIGRPTLDPAVTGAGVRLGELTTLQPGIEGRFVTLNADVGVSRTIRETGIWAAEDVALFRQLVRPADVVLDVGANIGHHSVVYSKLVGPGGRVYSFEPQRWIFNILCANLVANDCLNAYPFRMALGDQPGRLKLQAFDYARDLNFGAAALSKLFQDDKRGEAVPIQTLDAFVVEEALPRVDFIKLDVQTFELFVLQGARETLRRFRPRLFVEIAPYWMKRLNGYDHQEVYRLLADAGYELFNKGLTPIDAQNEPPPAAETEWDVIAIPQETPLARAA